jgi:hypothetical protein
MGSVGTNGTEALVRAVYRWGSIGTGRPLCNRAVRPVPMLRGISDPSVQKPVGEPDALPHPPGQRYFPKTPGRAGGQGAANLGAYNTKLWPGTGFPSPQGET